MLQHLVVPVEWKATAAAGGGLVGYASTFGNVDLGGDVVVKGAFAKSVDAINRGQPIPLLADHDASTASVIGSITRAAENDHGLMIEATFASTARGQDIRTLLREGHLSKMSIGYSTEDEDWGERDGKRVRYLKEVKLWETSVVVFPMNPSAVVGYVKSDPPPRTRTLDDRLAVEAALLHLLMEDER